MTIYKENRSLQRGLAILRAMNETGGTAIPALAAATGIHRTTVHRLLETLRAAGYVERAAGEEGYRLTFQVRALSEGFKEQLRIAEIAGQVLRGFAERIVWPTDFYVLEGDAMLCRETTHRLSPMSVHSSMIGRRWPAMAGAAGRAYLAFCPERERQELVGVLARSPRPDNATARDASAVEALVRATRQRGYAESVGELERRMSAVALPVRAGERLLGAVSLVFFTSAMSPAEAARRHLSVLRQAVEEIAKRAQQAT